MAAKGIGAWIARSREGRSTWYERYQEKVTYPLFLMGALFLLALGIQFSPNQVAAEQEFARWIIALTWVVFAIDYVIGLVLAPNRLRFMREHILQGVALIFPPLRLLLLGHIFHVMSKAGGRRGNRLRTYVLYLTPLTMVVAAIAVVFFESRDASANIKSFSDSLWWTAETVSTVGYGDFYPVTLGGRLVAAALFINGVALLSVITAGLAQNFLADDTVPDATDGASEAQNESAAGEVTDKAEVPVASAPVGADTAEGLSLRDWAEMGQDPAELDRLLSDIDHAVSSVRAKLIPGGHGGETTSDTPRPGAPPAQEG